MIDFSRASIINNTNKSQFDQSSVFVEPPKKNKKPTNHHNIGIDNQASMISH